MLFCNPTVATNEKTAAQICTTNDFRRAHLSKPITTFFAVPRAQILRREFLARAAGNHALNNSQ